MTQEAAFSMTPKKPTAAKSKKGRKKRRKQAHVTCQVCHKTFKKITATHQRQHGLTQEQYRRAFRAHTHGSYANPAGATIKGASGSDALAIAERIISDPAMIRDVANEVQEAIFSGPLRDRFRLGLTALISRRMEMHGKAAAALDAVRAELSADWRVTQGGANGGPTPTKDLVAIASVLGNEVKSGEELLVKAVKLCLEEYRSNKGLNTLDAGTLARYTGEGEVLPVPAELTATDRENMRTLWGMFDKAVSVGRTVIDVTPSANITTVSDQSAASDDPVRVPENNPLQNNAEVENRDEGNAGFLDVTALGEDEPF